MVKPWVSLLILLASFLSVSAKAKDLCRHCHQQTQAFSPFHDPQIVGCSSCHGGNGGSLVETEAHRAMERFPGRVATAAQSCGQSGCHANLIPLMENSIMHTLDGMIAVTRELFQESPETDVHRPLSQRLSEKGADSYLRKLCVSCHLGSERQHYQQTLRDRGGGCAACHLQTTSDAKQKKFHPRLTVRIHNDRCFGCHSRSGRISLNYVGLAEIDQVDPSRLHDFGYLPDRRLVEKKTPDIHEQAGMACIDCHTASDVMGTGKRVSRQREQLDIQCSDCHRADLFKKKGSLLTQREALYAALYPRLFHISSEGEVVVTEKQQSPLFHIQDQQGQRTLVTKLTQKALSLPPMESGTHHDSPNHQRLTCDSCHAAWAPQCFGCHIEYDANQTQWDHLQRKKTPGRWIESRWLLKNELPALGVTAENQIAPFVPGMNFILEKSPDHPPIVQRYYAQTSPHTTQKESRRCESCHSNEAALGLVTHWEPAPQNPNWTTPVGWIDKGSSVPGKATQKGARSFNPQEIQRIQKVGQCLPCHLADDPLYQDFQKGINQIDPSTHFLKR